MTTPTGHSENGQHRLWPRFHFPYWFTLVYLFIMPTRKTPPLSGPQSASQSSVFPGADAISADSERFARIGEALLGPLPIAESILVLAESDGMTPERALMQLSRWARGTMAPFLAVGPDGQLRLDLSTAEAHANRDLLRRGVRTQGATPTLLGTVDTEEVVIELFSAVDALLRVLEWHRHYSPNGFAAAVPWWPAAPATA
jgi:hypothetical protein